MSPSKVLEVMVVVGALLASSYDWGQSFPDTGPKLAPKFESKNPTSSESLAAESQNLTSNINVSKAVLRIDSPRFAACLKA